MNVFLDLEETVVTSWDENLLVNTTKVREWLELLQVKRVHVFSFAVWNEHDQEVFKKNMEPFLSKALGVTFLDCPTVQDFLSADTKVTGVHWDTLHDFISVRGKVDAFRSWCKQNFDGQHNVLLDDVVPNAVWENKDSGLKLEFVNVKDLE